MAPVLDPTNSLSGGRQARKLLKIPFHGKFEVGLTTYLDWLIVVMNADWFSESRL